MRQPPDSYRFGEEALLLGSWSARILNQWLDGKKTRPEKVPVAELGSGCGAALFAHLLLVPEAVGAGFEREEMLIDAARVNAANLGLAARASFRHFEIGSDKITEPGSTRLVMANPPWRKRGTGRETASRARRDAMTREDDNARFYRCAARLLAPRGFFCLILPLVDFCEFCVAVSRSEMGVRRALPLASFPGKDPDRALICCQKQAASDPGFHYPLTLYTKKDGKPAPTQEALTLCPWLGQNRRQL